MGILLGDKRLLESVNLAGDEEVLNDPWYVEGLSREHVKKAYTPRLYGSAQTPAALWKKNKLEYTAEMVTHANEEQKNGKFGIADAFKEFIINNCNPKQEMQVRIMNDVFTISCNRWKQVGEVTVAYDLYDTDTKRIRRVHNTKTKAVADLEQFRRYFVTLLVHNLDSQAADYVAGKVYDKYGFCLDVHDAFILSPIAADDARRWYAEFMDKLYERREEILTNYFKSIGITGAATAAWNALLARVVPVENFKARGDVLK